MSQTEPTSVEILGSEFSFTEMPISTTPDLEAKEPTQIGEGESAAIVLPNLPIPPITFPKRVVSGRYRGNLGSIQLELRVDVDRIRPMNRVSGDFYQINGGTTSYYGSFVVNSPTVTVTTSQIIIKGLGNYTFAAGCPVVQVTIARRTVIQPAAPAAVQFFTTAGVPGAAYTCAFESMYFRTVQIETDEVTNITKPLFNTYNTGTLPSGGPARNLSVVEAYAEAGIELVPTAGHDVINIKEAGANTIWSNAELHSSMQKHFTLWRDLPQWSVWQVVAQDHDLGAGLYGIMFDQAGKQRQGCAVFHHGIGGATPDKLRLQLYTYVHELGHCFNLMHSWQKSYATPPVPNRPAALSWMNYPWNFPNGGDAAFWKAFPFQFDNEEIIHLRHALRNNIIMGGNDFTVGSALGREVMQDPVRDESGLTFQISTHQRSFALGEPVVLELGLRTSVQQGRRVHTWLHPNCGMVKIVIRKPNGTVVSYEPLIDHLVGERLSILSRDEVIRDSAYIGYGKGGLYFDQPGHYQIRAVYAALDGSQVMSDILTLRVRYPVTAAEEELADLFMGDEQGTLLYLLGSDDESLQYGNDAFEMVLEKYAKHPMANYARLVKGFNAKRTFKTITEDTETRLHVRAAELDKSATLLKKVADSGVLDPVSTCEALSGLAEVQTKLGDVQAAKQTLSTVSAMAITTA